MMDGEAIRVSILSLFVPRVSLALSCMDPYSENAFKCVK